MSAALPLLNSEACHHSILEPAGCLVAVFSDTETDELLLLQSLGAGV